MKAVLFDFNGTLYDDSRLHAAAWKRFIWNRFGLDYSESEIFRTFIGPSNASIFRKLLGETLDPALIRQYSQEKEEVYRSIARSCPENLRLIEGAEALFDELARKGVPFTIATSSIHENVRFYLEELGLKRWLKEDLIVSESSGLPHKPDPAYFLEAARRLNVSVQDCLIVEDSKTGIEAAVRAGAWRIVAMDRSLSGEWLAQHPLIYTVIHDYLDFHRWIEI
ncbi:MAG: HAD family phosphatase [Christensenellales bacterium]|nr:HAD family phosphatase [Christensenellales bacterium]